MSEFRKNKKEKNLSGKLSSESQNIEIDGNDAKSDLFRET